MTPGLALPCPRCRRRLDDLSWRDAEHGACRHCQTEFEFQAFPALTAAAARAPAAAAVLGADSVCFFHAENRAEVVCDACGRFLCPVCTIRAGERWLCPACVALSAREETIEGIRQRTLYDNLALALTFLPLLIWPMTFLGAPAALGLAACTWRRPGSLVRGRHLRFVVASVFAAGEIALWVALFVYLAKHAHALRPRT